VVFLVTSFGHFEKKIKAYQHGPKDFWNLKNKTRHISSYRFMKSSCFKRFGQIFSFVPNK
jgi:hypothetical protein